MGQGIFQQDHPYAMLFRLLDQIRRRRGHHSDQTGDSPRAASDLCQSHKRAEPGSVFIGIFFRQQSNRLLAHDIQTFEQVQRFTQLIIGCERRRKAR